MGNWLSDWWYEISGQKEKDEQMKQKIKQINSARNFIFSYVKSPGFMERLQKALPYLRQYEQNPVYNYPKDRDLYDNTYEIRINPNKIYTKLDSPKGIGAYFERKTNTVYLPNKIYDENRVLEDYGNTAAHEYGHAISNSIVPQLKSISNTSRLFPELDLSSSVSTYKFKYADIFPHFRRSYSYLKLLSQMSDEDRKFYEKYPDSIYDISSLTHDANPDESYADLMALRYDLNETGIYDSRKANNIFTQEHLDKYKKLNRRNRIFDNFTDEDIIKMMNEIAQNNTSQDSQPLYAKRGDKLVSRKFND